MSTSNETTDLWTMVAEGNQSGRKARVTGKYKTSKLYTAIHVGIFGAAAVIAVVIIAASKGKF